MYVLLALIFIVGIIVKYSLIQRLLIYLLPAFLKWIIGRHIKRAGQSQHTQSAYHPAHDASLKSAMTVEEAAEILNVDQSADAASITTAHRNLLKKLHPDTGGSAYLTRQLNEARDVLLREKSDHA